MKKRVFMGMSGGVDSSVAAALLVEQGYDVTGVYMKNWSENLPGMQCPWVEDVADAKRVAVQLGIDFLVLDFQVEYKEKVVAYMIEEYKRGRTPNPDIMCNQEMKFKLFTEAAREHGADFVATGHYARVSHQPRGALLTAVDKNKDQTYFLYRVSSAALERTLFPLGEHTKSEVRAMAKQRGLWTADKKESMGICFVGNVGIREFLSEYVNPRRGDVIDRDSGAKIGRHDGAIFYTLGQRHGLHLGGGLPYYVVGKDMARNEVYVSRSLDNQALWRDRIIITDEHWFQNEPETGKTYKARVRHRAPLVDATVALDGQTVVMLAEPQRAVAPGQSVVLYDGELVVGGGVVQSCRDNHKTIDVMRKIVYTS